MDTVFLRNAWYVAAWAGELKDRPLSRTLLGRSILLMRLQNGTAVALGNRCPHRFAPLDRGTMVGDTIQCGYHGLRFDRTGACVHAPGRHKAPNKARLPAYAVAQSHGLIWIWGGDPESADLSLIPDLGPLGDPGRTNLIDNYLHVDADYRLAMDNLMDLSHVEFLHPTTLGAAGMSEGKLTVKELSRGVSSNRWMPGIEAPPFLAGAMGLTGTVDHWLDITWQAPSNLVLRVGLTAAGQPREYGRESFAYHLITPETGTSSHYFFAGSNEGVANDASSMAASRSAVMRVFTEEDKPMIEACQRMMAGADFWSLKPVLVAGDVGGVRARRVLQRLIEEERMAARARSAAGAIDHAW